jgi:hypothetical protein
MRYSARMLGGNSSARTSNRKRRKGAQRNFVSLLCVLCVLCGSGPAGAGKKPPKGAPLTRLPGKSAEIANLALPAPAQKCQNWAWAVAIETMLQAQNVPLKQNFWVQKVNGSEICVDALPAPDLLARAIDGRYVLDDGRKVRLESRYFAAPITPDDLIAPVRQGTPLLLFWNARAFVLRGLVFDEYIYPNGQRMFEIREIKLLDPLAPAKQRELSFLNGRDDPAELSGVFLVIVIPETPMPWQR